MLRRLVSLGRNFALDLLFGPGFSIKYVRELDSLVASHRRAGVPTRTLDLGCGKTPKNPFGATELFGIDVDYGIDGQTHVVQCDLGIEKLPFPDEHFDYVTAFDLIEHIPRLIYIERRRHSPFIFLMNEIWRVLRKDGVFLSDTPAFPRLSVFTDPTHVNVITPRTFPMYFCVPHVWASRYGFSGSFGLERQAWRDENLLSVLRKI